MPRPHSLLSKRNDERPRSDPPRELPQKYPYEIHQRSSPDRHQGVRLLIELESSLSNHHVRLGSRVGIAVYVPLNFW